MCNLTSRAGASAGGAARPERGLSSGGGDSRGWLPAQPAVHPAGPRRQVSVAHGSFPPAPECASAHCCLRSCQLQVFNALDALDKLGSAQIAPMLCVQQLPHHHALKSRCECMGTLHPG